MFLYMQTIRCAEMKKKSKAIILPHLKQRQTTTRLGRDIGTSVPNTSNEMKLAREMLKYPDGLRNCWS